MRKIFVARSLLFVTLAGTVFLGGCFIPLPLPGTKSDSGSTKSGISVSFDSQTTSIKSTLGTLQVNFDTLQGVFTSLAMPLAQVSPAASTAMKQGYRILGSITSYGMTVAWDDITRQITRISGNGAELAFGFSGKGENKRSATVDLQASPDKTTGSATLEVNATAWNPVANVNPDNPQFWYNEFPATDSVVSLDASLKLLPKGQSDQEVKLTVGASNFQIPTGLFKGSLGCGSDDDYNQEEKQAGTQYEPTEDDEDNSGPCTSSASKIPFHLTFSGSIPRFGFDQTLDLRETGASTGEVTLSGSFSAETEKNGKQDWKGSIILTADSKDRNAGLVTFAYENTTQKFKLTGTVKPKGNGSSGAIVEGSFVTADGSKELATLSFDSDKNKYPIIKYADGSTQEIKLGPVGGYSAPPRPYPIRTPDVGAYPYPSATPNVKTYPYPGPTPNLGAYPYPTPTPNYWVAYPTPPVY
ncbi:MAG: hypothetical protein HY692_01185 [Cyanobacteria bacterium NC_groundwater_1444_Ag_S-0.65um_54_12]|nr:hypothetical protein [Cyanobacteria bacterium NC_groundwater_1444_Ag_S-0.65um_54_12]